MKVSTSLEGTILTVRVEGRVDTTTAPELESVVMSGIGGAQKLVIDLEDVNYISSAGLRVLLSAHKKMLTKDGMKVKNVVPTVMEIFDVTGFADILDIE